MVGRQKYDFCHFGLESDKTPSENVDLKSKSSLLPSDFSNLLIVQYSLHTLYITQKHKTQFPKHIDPLCIEIVEGFYNFKKLLEQIKSDLISKSSFFTLYFSDWLIVQYTLHNLYTTQKHKTQFPKRIDPLCIEIVGGFYIFFN